VLPGEDVAQIHLPSLETNPLHWRLCDFLAARSHGAAVMVRDPQ
jgi:hypothetical protein